MSRLLGAMIGTWVVFATYFLYLAIHDFHKFWAMGVVRAMRQALIIAG